MNSFRKVSFLFFSLSVIWLSLGLGSYFWKPVPATLYSVSSKNIYVSGYGATQRSYLNYRSTRGSNYVTVSYSYNLAGKRYESSFIGFVLPVNIDIDVPDGNLPTAITAYYCPFVPAFSLIRRGVGWYVLSGLLLFGVAPLVIGYWIEGILDKRLGDK